MAQFKHRVLGVLDRIYGFVSDKTYTSTLNLDVPISLVHDVSRQAELGSGLGNEGGYFWMQYNQAVAGASSYRYRDDIYASVSSLPAWGYPVEEQYRIWYAGISLAETSSDGIGDVTSLGMGYELPINSMDFINTYRVFLPTLYTGNLQARLTDQTALSDRYISVPGAATGNIPWNNRPIQLPRGTLWGYSLLTGAAISGGVNFHVYYWIGKKGTTPPGLR